MHSDFTFEMNRNIISRSLSVVLRVVNNNIIGNDMIMI